MEKTEARAKRMQFEVSIGPGMQPVEPFLLWVGESKKIIDSRCPGCKHRKGYQVIDFCDKKHPLRPASNVLRGRRLKKPVLVCPCRGRLVSPTSGHFVMNPHRFAHKDPNLCRPVAQEKAADPEG